MRHLVLSALLLGGLACDWPQSDYRVTVQVAVDSGIRFSGRYWTTRGEGDSVAGTVPAQWVFPVRSADDAAWARFCKDTLPGTLTARFVVDGATKAEQSTSLPGGVVDLYWCPSS